MARSLSRGMVPAVAFSPRRLAFGASAGGFVNIVKAVLQLALLPVMAKLLSPHEFGLYALAAPSIAFAVTLADGGLGVSLAREPETSTIVWSTAFWVLLATGLGLAFGVSAWGLLLGRITHQSSLPALICVMSISLVPMTLAVAPGARLTRRGHLGTMAAADLASTCTGIAVAIMLARRGAGAYSLVGQYLATFAIRAIWLNVAAFQLPTAEFRLSVLRDHLVTGGSLIGQKLLELFERLGSNVMLGGLLGPVALGQYAFATQVSRFATDAAGNPAWSAIYVQSLRDSSGAFRLYAQLCRLMGVVLIPGSALVAVAAPDGIAVLLGPQWVPAGEVLRVILPTYAATAISAQVGALLLAHGRANVVLWSSCVASVGRIAAITSGYWFGLAGVALCTAAANLVFCAVLLLSAAQAINCRPRQLGTALSGPLMAGLAGAAIFLVVAGLCGSRGTTAMAAAIPAGAAASLVVLTIVDRPRLREDFSAVRCLTKL